MDEPAPYLVVVITQGTHPPRDPLSRTWDAFREHVSPAPAAVYIHQDGNGSPYFGEHGIDVPLSYEQSIPPLGFCAATAKAWQFAAAGRFPSRPADVWADWEYVFWLEHDFLIHHDVNLAQVAAVLEKHEDLAQIALVRNPCNPEEKRAGGLIESRPGAFMLEREVIPAGDGASYGVDWLSHRAFFTTNPSLMRRAFMAEHPLRDDGEPFCEGRYGAGLVASGLRFGYWGSGEEWCEHIGDRTGFGY